MRELLAVLLSSDDGSIVTATAYSCSFLRQRQKRQTQTHQRLRIYLGLLLALFLSLVVVVSPATAFSVGVGDGVGNPCRTSVVSLRCLRPLQKTTTTTARWISSRRHASSNQPEQETEQEQESTSSKPELQVQVQLQLLEDQLNQCQSGTAARRILESTLPKETSLYNSISIPPDSSVKGLSDGDLAIMTRIRNRRYSIMDLIELNGDRDADRASLAVFSIFTASTISALIANQNLPGPDILRFLVVWIFSFAPLAFVGYGITTPDQLQALLVQIQALVFPQYRQRMIQHEAGHFLMGHLLGLPIQTYQTNAVKNAVTFYPLNDPDIAIDRAQQLGFDKKRRKGQRQDVVDNNEQEQEQSPSPAYFSDQGRGASQINQQSVFRNNTTRTQQLKQSFLKVDARNEPTKAWPYRGFDETTMDKLTVISVAGVCAELLAFGNAEGGLADFNQLKQLFQSVDSRGRNEKDSTDAMTMSDREMDNRIRFALGYTMSQLRRHLKELDALAKVMERGGSVAECVQAIETTHTNTKTNTMSMISSLEEYEMQRKAQFQQLTNNPILRFMERVFLGEPKTADVEEDRFLQGKGGGGYKQEDDRWFAITGDDPLYLALGVAGVFLLWASSGGLTLH